MKRYEILRIFLTWDYSIMLIAKFKRSYLIQLEELFAHLLKDLDALS
jgi:hypothetical protein